MESNVEILNNNILEQCNNVRKESVYGGIYIFIIIKWKKNLCLSS